MTLSYYIRKSLRYIIINTVILKIEIIKVVDRLFWVVDRQYFILRTPKRKRGRSGIGNNVSTAGSNYRTHRERYCKKV